MLMLMLAVVGIVVATYFFPQCKGCDKLAGCRVDAACSQARKLNILAVL
jgi:hypothetical protein